MPDRQVPALLEQCGWLLAHPNCTNGELGDALAMAEGTRRSNISRLRHWLGPDGHGGLLLPAGRSGRLRLAREVCGDWQLVHGLLSDPTLVNL
ncbi:MAG: hypothetical protein LBR32_02825, partial [Propionibacteriaceae bacterium]|nr:hypothetical protein [Propionibacteriaceae bacterium]